MAPERKIHHYLLENEFTLDGVSLEAAVIPIHEVIDVDPSLEFGPRLRLKRPLFSAPMDTVTESRMAIAVALSGGIGVIHNGMSMEAQAHEVDLVRRYEAGFVMNPVVVSPKTTVQQVLRLQAMHKFSSFPVTRDGTLESKLVGIITQKDVDDIEDGAIRDSGYVGQIMTPRHKLVVAAKEQTLDKNDIKAANSVLRKAHKDTIIIVDAEDKVAALVTRSDLIKDDKYPNATKDNNKQLKVYAAIPPRFIPSTQERIRMLYAAGVNGLVIDSRNIYGGYDQLAKDIKSVSQDLDVIVGNIVSPIVLREVLETAGDYIDGFRIGIGTGEVCTTSEEIGIGRAMGSALLALDAAFEELNGKQQYGIIGRISDGGNKFPKHFIAANMLSLKTAIMMGTPLARFEEAPTIVHRRSDGLAYMEARGMGSKGAIEDRSGAGAARYGVSEENARYPEGIEKFVPYLGSVEPFLTQHWAGVRAGMQGLGARNLQELYDHAVINPAVQAISKGTL